ncbi:DUF1048 domain-containing protein [Agromyces sp. LHK192]|uniref:DUF1048 domain-containing protein n=1 Tax=Agromyces sp. LHK192 TaxID=2498704 RepID=UPI0013E3C125|nr:DUF1048 domain-containing protein [Agromyces sp. LHK192]
MRSTLSSAPAIRPGGEPAESPFTRRLIRLPAAYRAAFDAFEEYLADRVDLVGRRALIRTLDDLATCLEEAHAGGVSVRAFAGDDPAAVADALLANHADGPRAVSLRLDLARAIEAIERGAGARRVVTR